MASPPAVLGTEVARVDGRAKVTGQARYAADVAPPDLAHGLLVGSAVPSGRIRRLDAARAEAAPGVLLVLTAANRGPLGGLPGGALGGMMTDNSRLPLADDEIFFAGQPIALIVAETIEQARAAARLLDVTYDPAPFQVDPTLAPVIPAPRALAMLSTKHRGDVEAGLAAAAVRVDATYTTAPEHGCAMEPHATLAAWDGDELTVHDTTQSATVTQAILTAAFGGRVAGLRAFAGIGKSALFPSPDPAASPVRVTAPYLGGMFGTKMAAGAHVFLTVIAARRLGRPVRTMLTRQQVLTAVGHRPWTSQRLEVGATAAGELTALRHATTNHTSIKDDYAEFLSFSSAELYACPNYGSGVSLARLNVTKPSLKRAPGEAPSQFALESALDELAVALALDPVELRRRNETSHSPESGLPFSSRHLLECYAEGERRFGWDQRTAPPGSMRDGDELIGWGMATATLGAFVFGAAVRLRLALAGERLTATLATAADDAGMGTSTMLAMIVAEELGLPLAAVTVELGDSTLAPAITPGGSTISTSVAPATQAACRALREQLLDLAAGLRPGFGRRQAAAVTFRDGQLIPHADPTRALSLAEVMVEANRLDLEATGRTSGAEVLKAFGVELNPLRRKERHAFRSFGAQFVEVRVQPDLGRLRVARVVSVFDVGKVLNPAGARSQLVGGIVMGLGTALFEAMHYDPVGGGLVNNDLAEYVIPVHADMPDIDVAWLDRPDPFISALGARGLGEISNTGIPPAVANAVYHATGRRLRDLPLTLEQVMADQRAWSAAGPAASSAAAAPRPGAGAPGARRKRYTWGRARVTSGPDHAQ